MIEVGVVGATGYTGVELLRLLAGHPDVALRTVTSRSEAGKRVDALFPNLRGHIDLEFTDPAAAELRDCELVFFATPNGTAMGTVPELLSAGVRVIDLAADFRLRDAHQWAEWYGMEHACPELLEEAVYGLPELYREQLPGARLVANPGCYPTAVTLGLLPLIEQRLVAPAHLIADTKSGVSGAGRKAAVGTLLAEAGDNMHAYSVAGHRHHPEITQTLSAVAGVAVGLTFVPHLTPMIRGIHATLYARLEAAAADLQTLFRERYEHEAFVDVMPPGTHPETRSVRGANLCRISIHRPGGGDTVVVLSVIDNLVKGAAGQALQNMNVMFGMNETTGLTAPALSP